MKSTNLVQKVSEWFAARLIRMRAYSRVISFLETRKSLTDQMQLKLAVAYQSTWRWERALKIYEDLCTSEDEKAGALANWHAGFYLVDRGRNPQAIPFLERLIKLWPDRTEPYALLGLARLRHTPSKDVKELFEKALEIYFANPDAILGLTEYEEEFGTRENIIQILEDYVENAPFMPASHYLLAIEYDDVLQDHKNALPLYEAAIQTYNQPDHWVLRKQLEGYLVTRNFHEKLYLSYVWALWMDGADVEAVRVAKQNLSDANFRRWQSSVHIWLGEFDSARKILKDILAKSPQDTESILSLAYLELISGNYKRVKQLIWDLRHGGQLGSGESTVSAIVYLEIALRHIGSTKKAEELREEAKKIDETTYLMKSLNTYSILRLWDDVLSLARDAIALEPDAVVVHVALARAHIHKQNFKLAQESVQKALDRQPNNKDLWLLLAQISQALGEDQETSQLVQRLSREGGVPPHRVDEFRKLTKSLEQKERQL